MSCQFKTIARVIDVDKLRKYIFHSNEELLDSTNRDADPWNWSVKDSDRTKLDLERDIRWVNECHIALSPTGEILVLAHKHSMVILVSKWDSQGEGSIKTKYIINWNGRPKHDESEEITAVICLPLVSKSRVAAHGCHDWTCIAVGYSSGFVRFYTETGDLLFCEVLHKSAVTGLKCQSCLPPHLAAGCEQNEELHVLHKNVICCVRGFSLFTNLRERRNQLAFGKAQAHSLSDESVVTMPLSVRKLVLPEQGAVNDACVAPVQCPCSFTHLATASVCGGFTAGYRPMPPKSSLVLAAGASPFVGFHSALEGSSAPDIADVAKAVATKLKSAIGQAVPGWLLGGKKTATPPKSSKENLAAEPAEPMVCRFGLCDLWRQGERIVMSPNRKLCAVSDSLGRVILVDISSGTALRMWKGYRDAECGWVICSEESRAKRKRTAQFLLIYSPKKGIIEVWAMQQGPRIATFPVSKNGRLLYVGHNLLGFNSSDTRYSSESSSQLHSISSQYIFIDHTGELKEIAVPFHCALSDRNSKRARDVLIYKKLKSTLRQEGGMSEVGAICREFQTNKMKIQSLDLLCTSKYMSANTLKEILATYSLALPKTVVDDAGDGEEKGEESLDPGGNLLVQKIEMLDHLATFYQFLSRLRQKPPDYNTAVTSTDDAFKEELCNKIKASREEIDKVIGLIREENEPNYKSHGSHVSSLNLFPCAGELVCQGCLDGNCGVNEWQNAACESSISADDLMRLAINLWLSRKVTPTIVREMIPFSSIIKSICIISGKASQESSWWNNVRSSLKECENPLSSLTAALICRSVVASEEVMSASSDGDYDEEGNKEAATSSTDMEWENVSEESCQWSQIILQLEEISLLQSVLSHNIALDEGNSSQSTYENPIISLGLVLTKGKGYIPEVVAKWISGAGLDPALLLDSACLKSTLPAESSEAQASVSPLGVTQGVAETVHHCVEAQPLSQKQTLIIDELTRLRECFPYSLSSDSLLANVCWEYVLAWNRDVDSLTTLLAAINCLKVIPNPHIQQGMCSLIWSMHLKTRFEAALKLINKVGKVPKERLCRQDVGISDFQMSDFFKSCADFLEIFMMSNVRSEETEKTVQRSETLWDACAPVMSLTALALSQPPANYALLQLLSQAARATILLALFNIKAHGCPLVAFFNSSEQSALFADVCTSPQLPSHFHDPKLTKSRTQFLLKAISSATGTILTHKQQQWETKQAAQWTSDCFQLAYEWGVPVDQLRRQQVCQLYVRGFDRLAEEVVASVNDSSLLGSQLLVIAGQRLNKSLATSGKDIKQKIADLSTTLSKWLGELSDGPVENVPLAEILQLADTVLTLLPEDHPDCNLASQLVQSLQYLTKSDDSNPKPSATKSGRAIL
ncbi:rab3 GTPase-activating protein non-catalytic subunit [Nilaparvata lugens]|uniref:rab3 GTPase-activating protein non-catalytic subunit n=1 Tax=Nilaparvata lugens TaxID=108931 RepID=UPI00193E01EA|nr:rab3 GTPase-activating protein non-catalytic subunit [Nilaparvata lugens]